MELIEVRVLIWQCHLLEHRLVDFCIYQLLSGHRLVILVNTSPLLLLTRCFLNKYEYEQEDEFIQKLTKGLRIETRCVLQFSKPIYISKTLPNNLKAPKLQALEIEDAFYAFCGVHAFPAYLLSPAQAWPTTCCAHGSISLASQVAFIVMPNIYS